MNLGDATTADVLALMGLMRQGVERMSGISLEPEVRLLGAAFPWDSPGETLSGAARRRWIRGSASGGARSAGERGRRRAGLIVPVVALVVAAVACSCGCAPPMCSPWRQVTATATAARHPGADRRAPRPTPRGEPAEALHRRHREDLAGLPYVRSARRLPPLSRHALRSDWRSTSRSPGCRLATGGLAGGRRRPRPREERGRRRPRPAPRRARRPVCSWSRASDLRRSSSRALPVAALLQTRRSAATAAGGGPHRRVDRRRGGGASGGGAELRLGEPTDLSRR